MVEGKKKKITLIDVTKKDMSIKIITKSMALDKVEYLTLDTKYAQFVSGLVFGGK